MTANRKRLHYEIARSNRNPSSSRKHRPGRIHNGRFSSRYRPTRISSFDRFIPKRSRNGTLRLDQPRYNAEQPYYIGLLRKALFGEIESDDSCSRMLNVTERHVERPTGSLFPQDKSPFMQDILRPDLATNTCNDRIRSVDTATNYIRDYDGYFDLLTTFRQEIGCGKIKYQICRVHFESTVNDDIISLENIKGKPACCKLAPKAGFGRITSLLVDGYNSGEGISGFFGGKDTLHKYSFTFKGGFIHNEINKDIRTGYIGALEALSSQEVAAADEKHVAIYDARQPNGMATITFACPENSPVSSMKVNGNVLACAGRGVVQLWDIRNLTKPTQNFCHKNVQSLHFSPLERHKLATAGNEGVKVWDILSRKEKTTIHVPNQTVSNFLWSPFGNEILISMGKYRLSLWSAASTRRARKIVEWRPEPDNHVGLDNEIVSLDYLPCGKVVFIDNARLICECHPFGEKRDDYIRNLETRRDMHDDFAVLPFFPVVR